MASLGLEQGSSPTERTAWPVLADGWLWPFHVVRDYARTLREGGSRMKPHLPGYLALAAELEAAQAPLSIVFGPRFSKRWV